MKKSLIAVIIVLFALIILYIFNKKEYITCTKKTMNQDYTLLSTYKIYYQKEEVSSIEIKEKIEARTTSTLNEIIENIEANYKKYKEEIGSYDYTIKKEKNIAKTKVIINYNEIDMDKYLQYNPEANLNENKRYNIEDMKTMYEERGATCK